MKTVCITGIRKGIGKALAEKFLGEGWHVIGTVRAEGSALAHEALTEILLDLRDPRSIDACARAVEASGRAIDTLINNAGVLLDEDDTALDPEKLRATLEVNLIGTAALTEKLLPFVARGGHIVNISSTAGSLELVDDPVSHYPLHYPAYKISKAALNMYTRTLALRLKDGGITVSSVHPGWVRTDMGGSDAEISPGEAAEGIYALATSRPETGMFWFGNQKVPW